MKKLSTLLFFFSISAACFSQETKFKEYSYTQFFEMLEAEKDTIFKLENAIIQFDAVTDSIYRSSQVEDSLGNYEFHSVRTDSIHITKALNLTNVHFLPGSYIDRAGLFLMVFHKEVNLKNTNEITVGNSLFKERFKYTVDKDLISSDYTDNIKNSVGMTSFQNCTFLKGLRAYKFHELDNNQLISAQLAFEKCLIYPLEDQDLFHSYFYLPSITTLNISECVFKGKGRVFISYGGKVKIMYIGKNSFIEPLVALSQAESLSDFFLYEISENTFENTLLVSFDLLEKFVFDWDQLKNGVISQLNYERSLRKLNTSKDFDYSESYIDPKTIANYFKEYRIKNTEAFREESKLYGQFYKKYKGEQDIETANKVYVELKDLQTARFKYQYQESPSFKTFFTWKINQFLKVFSAYGTEPARAIIFSLYVILAFALIYLLFPNSWDAHGKNRIVDRYRFFFKYLQRNAGMHEVYLEEKKQDLLGYEEFKSIIINSEKSVPRFFSVTALPLYQWAVSGTQISAKILSKVDILKGTWEDLPAGQKAWKSFLLVGGFLIALVYDLLIKVLNALMLSINTFTTLGFGEIPIKGLPRYLAIIQGFIGWFMLTIFSVSLISQLLN
jgi:hypothetical protein